MTKLKKDLKKITELIESVDSVDQINENEINEIVEITESITNSIVTRSRDSKIAAAIGAIAYGIAKQKNDPLYLKAAKYKKLWKQNKEQIMQKYGSLARQKWLERSQG